MHTTRFVTDFASLITAVDRLMVDIGSVAQTDGNGFKPNGQARAVTLNGTISTLRDHAQHFVKTLQHSEVKPNRDPSLFNELALNLGRASTLKDAADTFAAYCSKTFRNSAGMVLVEQDGGLQIVSDWRLERGSKHMLDEIAKQGPVARVFRTGEPVFWSKDRPLSRGRYLHRLLTKNHGRGITLLPISSPGQRPVGVLAIVISDPAEFTPAVFDELVRLNELVSGWIVRAHCYDEVVKARARAEEAVQRKDEFLSILSHELKNPMMPIMGWAVALSSGTLSADKQSLALEGIVRNVRALNYLIEDLFDAMRMTSGKLRLELRETRIQDVAREALTAIQPTVASKKLRISTDISEGIPPFTADSRRLHQVVMNLLNNAVKFTPEGGSITLQVRKRNHTVECVVSDTGQGIERMFLPFVFERFRQGKQANKMHAVGLGLGLAIVREIIELHGGSVTVLSEGTDKGTTFIVRLPLRRIQGRQEKWTVTAKRSRPVNSEKRVQNIRNNSDIRKAV